MSSPGFTEPDGAQRRAALDPRRSFIVQAPAGSGKTELLVQRYLRLLGTVDQPESIVAITFTRKAAGEMRGRILDALKAAGEDTPVAKDHERRTRELASAALARNVEMGWDVTRNPGRLRIQTIDALCMSIAGAMPWLARLGAMPSVEDDTTPLYREAARRTLLALGGADEHAGPVITLLRHMDNNAAAVRDALAAMLASRDQWIELAVQMDDEAEREALEEAMSRVMIAGTGAIDRLIPADLHEAWLAVARARGFRATGWPELRDRDAWIAMADTVLTDRGTFRKQFGRSVRSIGVDLIARLEQVPGVREALHLVRKLPHTRYRDDQWGVMRALLAVLKLAAAKLHEVFREYNMIDFAEIGAAARRALGPRDQPEDLAYRLDFRFQHLLVDEFQDTSRSQFELLARLTAGWDPDDGRTLFLVGDPMQSIYRFRQAEVGLFLQVVQSGIGHLRPEPLTLSANYRTEVALHDRLREMFRGMFPDEDDARMGAIKFTPSQAAAHTNETDTLGTLESFTFDAFPLKDEPGEARRVIELIRAARERDPEGSVAILVRARTHLPAIVAALKDAGEPYQAQDIDVLEERSVVRDLLALTRAMLHAGDRISWFAILRAPWCGLSLMDLEALVQGRYRLPVWEALADLAALSENGQRRAAHLRDVLAEAFREQGRWPLRRWVERAWMGLGGPACLAQDSAALQNAADYLDLLEKEQAGADLPDFDHFAERMKKLFARPRAGGSLQLMTVHKAKGLEFDTVILPALGRTVQSDDQPLFRFDEWHENGKVERLLAPKPAGGDDKNGIYDYLRRIDRDKSGHERVRQFYVAATRAKKRLHLLALADLGRNGEPQLHTMLADVWPALSPEDRAKFEGPRAAGPPVGSPAQLVLRRLPDSWSMPALPAPAPWENTVMPFEEPHEPSFEWVGESLRLAGTVVHAYLQRFASGGAIPDTQAIRSALAHAGVTASDLNKMTQRVARSLEQARESARARWILAQHPEAHSEYTIAGVVEGRVIHGTVDRTFVDNGTRWIVDFKTSEHEGADLEAFLDEQQRRYRDQMTRYARLLEPLGLPVRVGLYFPLHDAWREW